MNFEKKKSYFHVDIITSMFRHVAGRCYVKVLLLAVGICVVILLAKRHPTHT